MRNELNPQTWSVKWCACMCVCFSDKPRGNGSSPGWVSTTGNVAWVFSRIEGRPVGTLSRGDSWRCSCSGCCCCTGNGPLTPSTHKHTQIRCVFWGNLRQKLKFWLHNLSSSVGNSDLWVGTGQAQRRRQLPHLPPYIVACKKLENFPPKIPNLGLKIPILGEFRGKDVKTVVYQNR